MCHLCLCVLYVLCNLVLLVAGWYLLICVGVAKDLSLTWIDIFYSVMFSMDLLLILFRTEFVASCCCLVYFLLFSTVTV